MLKSLKEAKEAKELIAGLEGANKHIKLDIIKTLKKIIEENEIKDSEINSALIKLLEDKDIEVCKKAIEVLGKIADLRPVPSLIKLLETPNLEIRESAVWALSETAEKQRVPNPDLLPALVKVWQADSSKDINYWASHAVKAIAEKNHIKNDPALILVLIKAMKDDNEQIRTNATYILAQMKNSKGVPSWVYTIKDSSVIREHGEWVLEQFTKFEDIPQKAPFLIELLDQEKDASIRARAAYQLHGIAVWHEISDPRLIPILLKALKDREPKVRMWAASSLQFKTDPSVEAPLIKAMQDKDEHVRAWSASALGTLAKTYELKDPKAITALIKAAQDQDESMRNCAVGSLKEIAEKSGITDPKVIPVLVKALQDSAEQIREKAAAALGKAINPKTVATLLKELEKDNQQLCQTIALTLTQITDQESLLELVKALLKGLKSSNVNVRYWSAEILARVENPHIEAGSIANVYQFENVCSDGSCSIEPKTQKQTKNPETIPALIKALEDSEVKVRLSAIKALGAIADRQATIPLIKCLEDTDSNIRAKAASSLGSIADRRATSPLINCLQDKNLEVRQAASYSLGKMIRLDKITDLDTIPGLVKALEAEKNYYVRSYIIGALGGLIIQNALSGFIEALEDSRSEVRYWAALALTLPEATASKIPGMEALVAPALINVLNDDDASVRATAAVALGKLKYMGAIRALIKAMQYKGLNSRLSIIDNLAKLKALEAIPTLIKFLQSNQEDIRLCTVKALITIVNSNKITNSKLTLAIVKLLTDSQALVRAKAAELLGQIGDKQATESLIKAIRDDFGFVRAKVAESLGHVGDSKAVPVLIKAMKDQEAYVREKAAFALGEIKSPKATVVLQAALQSSEKQLRANAAFALGEIKELKVVPDLIKALKDKETDVCKCAIEALGKIATSEAKVALSAVVEDEMENAYLREVARKVI